MTSVIRNHNTNPLKDLKASTAKECSCRQKYNCPLTEKCLSKLSFCISCTGRYVRFKPN